MLQNTSACLMRDELQKARLEKRINLKQITDKLCKLDMPLWLQSEILQMVHYNQYKRYTDPIEQAMEAAVNYKIILQLKNQTK